MKVRLNEYNGHSKSKRQSEVERKKDREIRKVGQRRRRRRRVRLRGGRRHRGRGV